MGLNQIGKNTTEEFFETFTFMLAHEKSKVAIKDFVGQIDPDQHPILREATESAVQIAVMQGIFLIIRFEEQMIQKIFGVGGTMITALVLYAKAQKSKLFGRKGRKLSKMLSVIGGDSNEAIATASLVSGLVDNYTNARSSQNSSGAIVQSTLQAKSNVINNEKANMQLAKGMSDQYTNSLLFKLFTSTFTPDDELRLKKTLGRNTAGVNIDDLNKVGAFMTTTDTNGNITGLSEQFMSLVNGLGYLHNK